MVRDGSLKMPRKRWLYRDTHSVMWKGGGEGRMRLWAVMAPWWCGLAIGAAMWQHQHGSTSVLQLIVLAVCFSSLC